jgi:hypothetical protein
MFRSIVPVLGAHSSVRASRLFVLLLARPHIFVPFRSHTTAVLCRFEALKEKRQQLVCRAETQLPPGIYLFDPSFDVLVKRCRSGSELKNERPSHLEHVTRRVYAEREGRVELRVKISLEP